MKTFIREPLAHFLAIGAALFAVHAWLADAGGDEGAPSDRVVRITEQDVAWLAESWSRQRMRPPSEDELHGLVSDYIKELLLAREAVELGLDENDTLVRRRLAQKMQFFMQDAARASEPSDEVLLAFHHAHPQRFELPGRIWFDQVFFGGGDASSRAAAALRGVADPADAANLGDQTLLPARCAGEDPAAIGRVFGEDFARRVTELEPGRWHGPIESDYGAHLVMVTQHQPTTRPDFATMRDRVLEAWYAEQQRLLDERYLAELFDKYDLEVADGVKGVLGRDLGPLILSGGKPLP